MSRFANRASILARFICLFGFTCLLGFSTCVLARTKPQLSNRSGQNASLGQTDLDFIQSRMDSLDLALCRQVPLDNLPRNDYRYLLVQHQGLVLRLYVQPEVLRSNTMVLASESDKGMIEYTHCNITSILPVLAIMATADIADENDSNRTRQAVLAQNSFLTSHESSYLLLRNDSSFSNANYLDFKVSFKHPVLSNAAPINSLYSSLTNVLEQLVPGENEYFLQLYLSFNGRFSQYIGERNSSPVVARSFNPTLFYRFWTTDASYLDLEFGHESNGQRISTLDGLRREEADFIANAENPAYARDSLSRGWDYTAVNWQRSWNDKLVTQFKFRHYLSDGPLQDEPEEYQLWEDAGSKLRPRRQYDGISLGLQYNFNRSRCLLGSFPICFQKVGLTQETGYSALFEHNTTTLELTTDFFGLPIQLWGKTGYNSSLVDYFDYTSSWGLGIELLSR